jgi:GntR family transcriptional regulator
VVAPADVAERLGLSANNAIVVRRENWYYADGEPVQLGVTYMLPAIAERAALAAITTPESGGLYARLDQADHRLVRAREEIQARLPTSDEATALHLPSGVPVLEVLHTGFGTSGRPIEVTRFVLRADLIGIDCELPVGD